MWQLPGVQAYICDTLKLPKSLAQPAQNQAIPPPDPKAEAALISAKAQQTGAEAKLADVQLRAKNMSVENSNRDADRAADLKIAAVKLKTEQVIHGQTLKADMISQASDQQHDLTKHAMGLGAAARDNAAGLQSDMAQHVSGIASDHALAGAQQKHEQSMASKVKAAAKVTP